MNEETLLAIVNEAVTRIANGCSTQGVLLTEEHLKELTEEIMDFFTELGEPSK